MRVTAYSAMVFVAAVVILLGTSPQAQAVLITSSLGTEFYDNFESGTIGSAPDNGTYPGAWRDGGYGYSAVTNAASPGVFQGVKYLKGERPSEGAAEAKFQNGTLSTGTIHAEWMYYIPAGVPDGSGVISLQRGSDYSGDGVKAAWPGDYGPQLIINSPTLDGVAIGATAMVRYYSSGWKGGPTITTNAWHKWEIDADLDVGTFTLKFDGGASNGPWGFASYGGGGLDRMNFSGGNGGDPPVTGQIVYIDAVPEPSTLALLGTGLLGLICYAWRKRK